MRQNTRTPSAAHPGRRIGLLILAAALLAILAAVAPTAGTSPPQDEGLDEMPVESQPPSRATLALRGKFLYRENCANCHGDDARGGGDLAQYLTVRPADLTRLARRHGSELDEETLRKAIDGRQEVAGHGRREMPVWGDAFRKGDDREAEAEALANIEALIAYLETLQKGG